MRRGGTRTRKLNQWLKRLQQYDKSIERSGKQREILGEVVSIVYILYIISLPYAPELLREMVIN